MWLLAFRLEMTARRFLAAAERFLRSLSRWYPARSMRGWEATWAAIEQHMSDCALWAELADALGEDCEATIIRPVSRVRPYLAYPGYRVGAR